MLTAGVKFTHDAAVAVFDGNRLLFSIEAEKVANGARYAKFKNGWVDAHAILKREGIALKDINSWSIDGGKAGGISHMPGEIISRYHEFDGPVTVFPSRTRQENGIHSFSHVAGHVIGAYALSPFSATKTPCYVIVADGGLNPRAYRVDPKANRYHFVGAASPIYGKIFSIAGYYFGPYRDSDILARVDRNEPDLYGQYDWPGKLMSWVATAVDPELCITPFIYGAMREAFRNFPSAGDLSHAADGHIEHEVCRALRKLADDTGLDDASALGALHRAIADIWIDALVNIVPMSAPMIFTGGSALNIKLNSRLAAIWNLWVPPVANDSGSAIGAACCALLYDQGISSVEWSVFSGPKLLPIPLQIPGWYRHSGGKRAIAEAVTAICSGAIVMKLSGRSEIGPRALGARSLLASPFSVEVRDALNAAKGREAWRPVAPICLSEEAEWYFDGKSDDHFMLYDHNVRHPGIKAVEHIDGTARTQVVLPEDVFTKEILIEHKRRTGCGILCNTSANENGKGFFGDFETASTWAAEKGVDYILYDAELYVRYNGKEG